MIKIATPKEHPYSSHISKFAMFPSFRSPDDPETGVRAAFQPFLNPLIPNCAPNITLLSKTMGKRATCCGKRGWYMFPERLKTSLLPCTGAPYRHEVLETPMATRTKAVTWTGENGFLDVRDAKWIHITVEVIQWTKLTTIFSTLLQQTKPLKGQNQVFYPTPSKTVLPNPKLRAWDLSLSERTSNMLRNLERTHWVTSYQMHYTGKEQL